MTDHALIAKIGQTIWGASWQAPMAAALKQPPRTIEDWSTGRLPVPVDVEGAARGRAPAISQARRSGSEIVRAFDASYQRAMAGKR